MRGIVLLFIGQLLVHAGLLFGSTITLTVPSTAGPWNQSLNPTFDYARFHDNTAPIVINAASGVAFYPGGTLTVTYASGGVSPGVNLPSLDANGGLEMTNGWDFNTNANGAFPAHYMNTALTVYLAELVGTFANDGVIVGTPFAIGNGPTTLTIPAGANQLLLGINDNFYGDNTGVFNVTVSSPFNVCLLYDPTKPAKSGSTIPIKIQVCTATGDNLSSSSIVVHATGVSQTSHLISGPPRMLVTPIRIATSATMQRLAARAGISTI